MALPRSKYVKEGQEGVYHCFSRCVRRAFLYGFDPLTGRDYSHRKEWLVDRLRHLAAIFAIEVCAYAVLATHYHVVLRTRPDIVARWSDLEVAKRWLTLFPRLRDKNGAPIPPTETDIRALADNPVQIAKLRQRLCGLSWFMGRLNEFLARAANKEDQVKGRFWESRFKCTELLDDAATVSCMVYVDLNLVRAGLAATPEESDFTSVQERIRAWQKQSSPAAPASGRVTTLDLPPAIVNSRMPATEDNVETLIHASDNHADIASPFDDPDDSACWLCPIQSNSKRRGILQMTAAEYFELVDKSGRMMKSDKPGVIDAELAPILLRIGAKPQAWLETVTHFGSRFRLAAGLLSNMRNFAYRLGQYRIVGMAAARTAFTSSLPQTA